MASFLTGCMTNTPVETIIEETIVEVSSETTVEPIEDEATVEITEKETTIETSSETTAKSIEEETAIETTVEETTVTETTEHSPVLTLQQIKFNGVLPDGEYFAMISPFNEDCSGAVFNVNGYWYLTEEQISNLITGDIIIMGTAEYEITVYDDPCSYFGVEYNDVWGTEKQRNGLYYIRGDADTVYTYDIVDNYYIPFAPSIEIYSDVNIYGQEELVWNETTVGQPYESSFKYNTPQEYARDVTENGGTTWGCHIVVENGFVTKIYANPQLHQAWMSQEVWEKYHS